MSLTGLAWPGLTWGARAAVRQAPAAAPAARVVARQGAPCVFVTGTCTCTADEMAWQCLTAVTLCSQVRTPSAVASCAAGQSRSGQTNAVLTSAAGAGLDATGGGAAHQAQDVADSAEGRAQGDVVPAQRDHQHVLGAQVVGDEDVLGQQMAAGSGPDCGLLDGAVQHSHVAVLITELPHTINISKRSSGISSMML